jgi:hypothetical protein
VDINQINEERVMSDAHKQFPEKEQKKEKENVRPVSIKIPEEMLSGNLIQSSPCDSRYLMSHQYGMSESKCHLMDCAQFADSKRCEDPTIFTLRHSRGTPITGTVLGLACLPQSQRVLLVTRTQYLLYDQKEMEGSHSSEINCSYLSPLMMDSPSHYNDNYNDDYNWYNASAKIHVFPDEKQFCVVGLNSSFLGIEHLDTETQPDNFLLAGVTIVDSDVVAPHYLALVRKECAPPPKKGDFNDDPYNKAKTATILYEEAFKKYEQTQKQRLKKEDKTTAVYLYDTRKLEDRANKANFLKQGEKFFALPNLTSITAARGGKWCIVTQAPQTEKEVKSNMGTLTVLEISAGKMGEMPTAKPLAQFKYNVTARPVIVNGKVVFCPSRGVINSYDPLTKMTSVTSYFDASYELMYSTAMGLCLYAQRGATMHLFPKDLTPLIEAVAEGLPQLPRDLPSLIAHYVGFFTRDNYPVEESFDTKKANILKEINLLVQKYKPAAGQDRKDNDKKNIWHAELSKLYDELQKKDKDFADVINQFCPHLKELVAPEKRKGLLGIFAGGGNQDADENNLATLMEKIRNLDALQRSLKK